MSLMPEDHLIQTLAADAPNMALDLRMPPRTMPGHHHLLAFYVLDAVPRPKATPQRPGVRSTAPWGAR